MQPYIDTQLQEYHKRMDELLDRFKWRNYETGVVDKHKQDDGAGVDQERNDCRHMSGVV